jgi:hypothetical protein
MIEQRTSGVMGRFSGVKLASSNPEHYQSLGEIIDGILSPSPIKTYPSSMTVYSGFSKDPIEALIISKMLKNGAQVNYANPTRPRIRKTF